MPLTKREKAPVVLGGCYLRESREIGECARSHSFSFPRCLCLGVSLCVSVSLCLCVSVSLGLCVFLSLSLSLSLNLSHMGRSAHNRARAVPPPRPPPPVSPKRCQMCVYNGAAVEQGAVRIKRAKTCAARHRAHEEQSMMERRKHTFRAQVRSTG